MLDDLSRSFAPEEVLAEQLAWPPFGQLGQGFAYTNAGYQAVGLLIERELDQDLASVIEERFTKPLSFNDTVLSDGSSKPTRRGWFSLDEDTGGPLDYYLGFPHEAVMTTYSAAGGMISSSEDLLDWGEALYSGRLLGEETTATMLEMPDSLYSLGAEGYCLNPSCSPDEVEVVGKRGDAPWTAVRLAHHRDSGTTIVIHANADVEPVAIPLIAEVLQQLGVT